MATYVFKVLLFPGMKLGTTQPSFFFECGF